MLKVKFKLESSESKSDAAHSDSSKNKHKKEFKFMNLSGHAGSDPNLQQQLADGNQVDFKGTLQQQEFQSSLPNTLGESLNMIDPLSARLTMDLQKQLLGKRLNPFVMGNGQVNTEDYFANLSNKRVAKEDRKNQNPNEFLTTTPPQSKRSAIRAFVNHSKSLRFSEKMHNVMVWRRNQMKYAAKHNKLDSPKQNDIDVDETEQMQKIQQIEEEFANKKFKFSEQDKFSSRQSNKALFREQNSSKPADNVDRSSVERLPLEGSSCNDEELVSLPRSKSLSNNRSGSSMCAEF